MMREVIHVVFGEFPVRITRRQGRSMTLRISEKQPYIRIGIPPHCGVADAEQFLCKNINFVRNAVNRIQSHVSIQHSREEYADFFQHTAMRLEHWRQTMNMPEVRLRMRSMTSRWGSCIPSRKIICINSRLIDSPPECLDYVIIHELAHLTHPNHSKDFWRLVEDYCPEWRRFRHQLRI